MGIRRVENMCGGKGHVIIKDILEGDELKGKCGLYAQVTIEKGCSLGYHEHHGETESSRTLTKTATSVTTSSSRTSAATR